MWQKHKELHCVFELHMRNLLCADKSMFEKDVVVLLCHTYQITSCLSIFFKYVGLTVIQKSNCILFDHVD